MLQKEDMNVLNQDQELNHKENQKMGAINGSSCGKTDMLNENQELAVKCRKNLLIVAGAGTGKTKTLISKISYYIEQGFLLPNQVIATTFTNKAAHEMKSRLEVQLGHFANGVSIGTFHKLSLGIVQDNAQVLGFDSVQVLSYDDQLQLIRKIMNHMKYKTLKPSQLLEMLQRAKEKSDFSKLNSAERDILDIYQNRLKDMNALDFADLIVKTIELWEMHPEILARYQEQYKLICVDEYQDINEVQHKWLKLLSNADNQVCCVGDPDQAIYSFRGSDIKYILSFKEDFSDSEKVVLDQNYRSTNHIINNANSLISRNKNRIDKNLIANIKSEKNVDVFVAVHEREEGNEICKLIASEKEKNPNCSVAILFRTGAQMDSMEECLLNANIKYSIVGAIQLLNRAEIKDAISYVRFLANSSDIMAFNRLIQAPKIGIGQVTLDKIANSPGHEVKEKIQNTDLSEAIKNKLSNMIQKFETWKSLNVNFAALMERVINESGLFDSVESNRQENLIRWIESIKEFKDAEEYANYVLWTNVKSEDDSSVQLMTVHAAKGLEFDIVFLPGWEEDVFPHVRSKFNIEEERRLAYVAITRAKKYLAISYAQSRMQHGRYLSTSPSRFLKELKSSSFQSFKQKNIVGKNVFHDTFGYGVIEETGVSHAQVKFGNQSKIVALSALADVND